MKTQPSAQKEYFLISKEELEGIMDDVDADKHYKNVQSRPIPSPQFNSTELLLLAHDEWKRRQERKHLNDSAPWVSGFIEGFLTGKKWARDFLLTKNNHEQS
jgi:hypothetical protein